MLSLLPDRNCRSVAHTIFLAATLIVFFATGCVSVKMEANKDEASVRKVNRLFVLIEHGDVGPQPYSSQLASALRGAFTNTPVALEISIANPVEIDESAHRQRMDRFECDAVLVIRATGGVIGEFGGYPTIIYDASLFEPKLDKRLWRARVDNSGGTALMKQRFQKMADDIVRRLTSDGFI